MNFINLTGKFPKEDLQFITGFCRLFYTVCHICVSYSRCYHLSCPCRMIDWLSWPLAHHVDTWIIALLKGLAAVQKFTILIDVTLLKIELVCSHY